MLTQHRGLTVRSHMMPLIVWLSPKHNEYYSILLRGWECSTVQSRYLKWFLFINQSTHLIWVCPLGSFSYTTVIILLYSFAAASLSCFNLSSSVIPINLVWKDYTALGECVCVCFCTSVSTNPFSPSEQQKDNLTGSAVSLAFIMSSSHRHRNCQVDSERESVWHVYVCVYMCVCGLI